MRATVGLTGRDELRDVLRRLERALAGRDPVAIFGGPAARIADGLLESGRGRPIPPA